MLSPPRMLLVVAICLLSMSWVAGRTWQLPILSSDTSIEWHQALANAVGGRLMPASRGRPAFILTGNQMVDVVDAAEWRGALVRINYYRTSTTRQPILALIVRSDADIKMVRQARAEARHANIPVWILRSR